MKISGIISFIIMLLIGLLIFFLGMSMECVLKSSKSLIVSSITIMILGIITFILSLKEKQVAMRYIGFLTIVVPVILIFSLMGNVIADSETYSTIFHTKEFYTQICFMGLLVTDILGIVNTILAFAKRQQLSN